MCLKKSKYMNVKVFSLMSGVNETRFLVQNELCECKCSLMKMYVIQSKNAIMMSVGVSVTMIGLLVKMIICGILAIVTVKVIRHVILMNI